MADFNLSKHLLAWFDLHGRKDLPWQKNITPYRVWVSEIMLQQTQVKTVIPYYQAFMKRFPSLKQLAQASNDEVMHYWSGLGYYSRARNLHKTAQIIHQEFSGRFPNDQATIETLPGIGQSTAGAICAIVFKQHTPILDGNVKRVLARFHQVNGWTGKTAVQKQLWKFAEQHTPAKRVADYTQAIMDLGATVCTRTKPKCTECPLSRACLAFNNQVTDQYPNPKPKKHRPVRETQMLIITHKNQVLLEKRPPMGIWPGLWCFPEVATDDNASHWCQQQWSGVAVDKQSALEPIRHQFSHYTLEIDAQHIALSDKPKQVAESNQQVWYDLQQPPQIGTSAVVSKLLKQLSKRAL